MNRSYFYFAATLPSVSFESEPPFTIEEFLGHCRRLLEQEDFLLINNLFAGTDHPSDTQSDVFNQWVNFIKDFRNNQAWFRAEAAGADPADFIRGDHTPNPGIIEVLTQASKAENPLEAQRIIDQFKWKFLDELEVSHAFDFGYIMIYALKLKILKRYEVIKSPKGEEIYKDLKEIEIPSV